MAILERIALHCLIVEAAWHDHQIQSLVEISAQLRAAANRSAEFIVQTLVETLAKCVLPQTTRKAHTVQTSAETPSNASRCTCTIKWPMLGLTLLFSSARGNHHRGTIHDAMFEATVKATTASHPLRPTMQTHAVR